jgi:protein subunit release factor A
MDPPSPLPDDDALLAECDIDTLSGSTSGGQRANKVETGVRLRHHPSGLIVTSRSSRSQFRNKALALAELRRRLEEMNKPVVPRRATKPTKGSKRRRLEAKKRRSETKAQRRSPDA